MIINHRKLDFLNFLKTLCISERYIYNLSKKNNTFYMLFHELKNRYIGHAVQHTNPMYVRHALVVVHYKNKGVCFMVVTLCNGHKTDSEGLRHKMPSN